MLDIADFQNGNVPRGKTKTAVINESGLYALENPKTYNIDYSLYPFWVKWVDKIIEFFERIIRKEF